MIVLENKFNIGQAIYLRTDPQQLQRIVTGIALQGTQTSYCLALGMVSSWHQDFEVSEEKNIVVLTRGD